MFGSSTVQASSAVTSSIKSPHTHTQRSAVQPGIALRHRRGCERCSTAASEEQAYPRTGPCARMPSFNGGEPSARRAHRCAKAERGSFGVARQSLTPTSIKFNRFLKFILLEHKPLLACFGFETSQKWLVSVKVNLRKQQNLIDIGAESYRCRDPYKIGEEPSTYPFSGLGVILTPPRTFAPRYGLRFRT